MAVKISSSIPEKQKNLGVWLSEKKRGKPEDIHIYIQDGKVVIGYNRKVYDSIGFGGTDLALIIDGEECNFQVGAKKAEDATMQQVPTQLVKELLKDLLDKLKLETS